MGRQRDRQMTRDDLAILTTGVALVAFLITLLQQGRGFSLLSSRLTSIEARLAALENRTHQDAVASVASNDDLRQHVDNRFAELREALFKAGVLK